MIDTLIRAADSAIIELRRQLKMPICRSCDPGDEGSEVLSELADDLTRAIAATEKDKWRDKANWYEGVADDLYQRKIISDKGKDLMYSWAGLARKES